MEYKHIARDTERYPGSPHLTLSRFQGLNTDKRNGSTKTEELLLIFDVSFVEEHETVISIPEPGLLQVSIKHGFKSTGQLSCRRDCTYTFKFSKEIKVENLIVQRTEDDFLIIKEKRPAEVAKSDESGTQTPVEPENKRQVSSKENVEQENSNVFAEIKTDEELSYQNIEKIEHVKDTEEATDKFEMCATTENYPLLIPKKVEKIFKPIISVVEMKSFMSDIQDRMLFVKNFIDNYSFDTCEQSSGTQVETKTLQRE